MPELSKEALDDLAEVLVHIRLPLIPTELLVKEVYPSKLIDPEQLFIASAY